MAEIQTPEPKTNPHLYGHEAVEAMLLADMKSGRLHHAYMFCGPKGIGKATLAYRFARHLLKSGAVVASEMEAIKEDGLFAAFDMPQMPVSKPEAAPVPAGASALYMDEGDPIFKRVAAGAHTDLLTLAPLFDAKKQQEKAEIGVAEARKVGNFLALTPAESNWRVVIIDAVDQLNTQSSNALLKILEEPPPNSILLLVCHAPAAALATIRSRCRKVVVQSCTRAMFDTVLREVAPHIPQPKYASLYALSRGCPGQAIQLEVHHAVETYAAILNALRPSGSLATRQKFAEGAHNTKSPAAWAMILDMWGRIAERVWLPASHAPSVLEAEAEILAELRDAFSIEAWCDYRDRVATLLRETNVYNLEKRQSAMLMVSPKQLLKAQAAA